MRVSLAIQPWSSRLTIETKWRNSRVSILATRGLQIFDGLDQSVPDVSRSRRRRSGRGCVNTDRPGRWLTRR
jgi:hypothetical protein